MDKKLAAKTLYFEGWPQKEIARTLKCAEKTVSSWKRSDKWDEQRAEQNHLRDSAADQIMLLINHQLKVLNKIKDKFNQDIDKNSSIETLNKSLIQNGQIDALYKMFAAVKGKELQWTNYVKVIRELYEYMAAGNTELAKQMIEAADDFLNTKRQELS